MTQCILVTGGCGFIGSHIVVLLQEQGFDVVIIDNLLNSSNEIPEKIQKITGIKPTLYNIDICNEKDVDHIFELHKFQCVIHLAALKAVGESVTNPLLYYKTNVTGSLVLLEAMKKHNVFNFIYSSSATVYGSAQYLPVDEIHPTGNCTNPYGKSKFIVEEMLKDLKNEKNNWKIYILRYFNPIGAHESGIIGESPNGIPNNIFPLLVKVATGEIEKLKVFGNDYDTVDGTGERDYIHVVDLAQAHVDCISNIAKLPVDEKACKIYNVGTGKSCSVLELISTFEKVTGQQVNYEFTSRRPGDIDKIFTSPDLAKLELGWVAKRDIKTMCQDAWNWVGKN